MDHSLGIGGALCVLVSLAALGGCSSGGGGGGANGPALASSVFVGAGAAPAAGDALLLVFAGPIELAPMSTLDDTDFEFQGGGSTLGALTTTPTVIAGNTLQIVLGAGVDLVPGTTRLSFSEDFDAVQGVGAGLAIGETPVTVTAGDGEDPVITSLTINGIDRTLNGSGAAGGTLQTPRSGFTIDLEFTDSVLAVSDVILTASGIVSSNSNGTFFPGDNFTDVLGAVSAVLGSPLPPGTLRFEVGPDVIFAFGAITITAQVVDMSGRVSAPVSFSFQTTDANSANRPFEATQVWFIDVSRDLEAFTPNPGVPFPFNFGFDVVDTPNGRSDFEDILQAMGLLASTPSGTDATVRDRLLSETIDELNGFFPGVDILFTTTSQGAFPSSSSFPFSGSSFSQMCFAGAATEGGSGTLGAAIVDPNNATHNDNCQETFGGTTRLGVFVHTIADVGVSSGPSSDFVMALAPFLTILNPSAIPIGDDMQDAQRLAGSMNDARKTQIDTAIATVARVIAVVAAHEFGHSMGLVIDGAMPIGLYGGDRINFPLSAIFVDPDAAASNHIENSAGFPGDEQNIMSPAIGIEAALDPDTRFNSLNMSYLREQALYNPQ
ncbi:MAG: hypothetical protein AAF196_00185 [Planctomycetota bacterium]